MSVKKNNQYEKELHPLLTKFNKEYLSCYSKTIDARRTHSTKRGKAEWLHPDIVSIQFPDSKYSEETKQIREFFKDNAYKIYSFEIKQSLSFESLKESYFQAVSNSSWAHEGYLVTFNVDDDIEFLNEVKRMNNSFGIGIIDLNKKSVLLPAQEKEHIDWETFNLLTTINEDFRSFANKISQDIKNLQHNKNIDIVTFDNFYDEILTEDAILNKYTYLRRVFNIEDTTSQKNVDLNITSKNEDCNVLSSNIVKKSIYDSWSKFTPNSLQINDTVFSVNSIRDCYKKLLEYLISNYIESNKSAFAGVIFNSEEEVLALGSSVELCVLCDCFYVNIHSNAEGLRKKILQISEKLCLEDNFAYLIKDI